MDGITTSPLLAKLPRGYRNDRQYGLVYEIEPAGADDLSVIAGIGTREAVILNRLGVYFVAQIGLWRNHELVSAAHELQLSPSRIVDEQWIEQAQAFCNPLRSAVPPVVRRPDMPASFFRTFVLLASALLIGFLFVNLLRYRSSHSLHGILSADITAMKVPATSRLIAAHVKPGDKVLSGAPLLTLEKVEHVIMIEDQQRRVQQLERELHQAEAQATLDVAWRTRELERELFDVQSQAEMVRSTLRSESAVEHQTVGWPNNPSRGHLSAVSSSHVREALPPSRPGGILFFGAKASEMPRESQIELSDEPGLPPRPVPVGSLPAPTRIAQSRPGFVTSDSSAAGSAAALAQSRTLESRLARLESLRSTLPEQVRQAAGVESLRARFTEASLRLDEMKSVSREVAVRCPAYGTIGQVTFREGDKMAEGEVMLKILHTDRRFVIVYVPAQRVNELQPASEVALQFPDGNKYRGQVMNVPLLADTIAPGGESLAAVRIEPVGRLWPNVPIGSQIDVAAAE